MVNPLNWFRRREYQQPDPFAVKSGGQRLVDPQLILNAERFYVGLRHEDRIGLYYSVYKSMPLAVGAVNVLTRMTNKAIVPRSGNPAVDARMRQIWQEINGFRVNDQLIRQSLIYGYSVGEWVSNDMQRIEKVHVPESPYIRFVADRQANITFVRQLQGTVFAPTDERSRIPSAKFIILQRDPTSSTDYYGSSLFEAATEQLESLCQILKAQISVYMRLGRPKFVVTIPAEGLTPEQFQDRLTKAQNHFEQLSQRDATDLYMPSGVEVKIIGAESFGQRFADETRLVIQNILAAVGIPPALLHVVTQASGGAESWVRQSVISLQSMLDNIQEATANAWNQSFWPIVQRIEGMPVAPVMSFEKPRLLEQLQEEKGREARFNNDLKEVVFGIRPAEWLAQRTGATGVDDPAALNEAIERARDNPNSMQDISNEETNSNSNTKTTDERASNNTTG